MANSGKNIRRQAERLDMPPRTTVWSLDPHTEGKHKVLERYMQAWLPILATQNDRNLFIDGFAGPGEYKNGELGSPLIVMKALSTHHLRARIGDSIQFLFIEKDQRRAEHLKSAIRQRNFSLPTDCHYEVKTAAFDDAITELLESEHGRPPGLPPSFVMIDPFGFSGVRMDTVARLLRNKSTEVYISFMYKDMNRFLTSDNHANSFTDMYGCDDWQEVRNITDPEIRKAFLFKLYEDQLRQAGASQVVHFQLYKGNQLVYSIFFGTNSLKGCDEMKKQIWSVTDSTYSFRDKHRNQMSLELATSDYNVLRRQLQETFAAKGPVDIAKVTSFVMSDHTIFHTGHLKQRTLAPMEKEGDLTVVDDTRKRKGTYPEGTRIELKPYQYELL